ncbi:GntR family transcriptional regulator [Oricola thermophila]|uniref:GntR family transcriptional regulator n=1 Tax=Oricola thermophila TaxID=2742145 RepID=A0A6N1V9U2_9HYPH|nr:GntR family transcriptional regulator [Oricola thermophila]QKV17700.1 GntR family transcriptional regulator [Oricola thermophila]
MELTGQGRKAVENPAASRKSSEAAQSGAPGRAVPLYRKAFGILAARIQGGEIAAGARLQESQIASQFGISRAPARHALALLEKHGLVAKLAGRGYRVRADAVEKAAVAAADLARLDETTLTSAPSWEQIYGEIESEIVARIPFGSWRIREADLARHYGVSRTVSRDVLGRLQQRGVVQKDERSHWFAPELTPGYVAELYELRWTLEPLALTKAASRIPPALLAQMRRRLTEAMDDPAAVDGAVLDMLEEDLHIRLLRHCSNRALMQAITLPQSLLIAHKFLYRWTKRMFLPEPFLPEHADILDRLVAGDVAGAADALENHLRMSLDRAVSRVEAVATGFEPDHLSYLQPIS